MKSFFFIVVFLLFEENLIGQISLNPVVIAASGGHSNLNSISVSWTIGETFTTQLNGFGTSVSEGFQQNTKICLTIVDYQYVKSGNPYQGLFHLTDGMIINQIPEQVSILVTDVCSELSIESFEMNIQGPELNWNIIQNVFPNALFDNFGNNVFGRNFVPGNYSLTVTGYERDNKQGEITYGPVITNFVVSGNIATVSMPNVSSSIICAGSNVSVSFSTIGEFNPDNEFQIQLSDVNGSFDSPIIIGKTSSAGTVSCKIPLNVPESSNYLIRVVSSNQVYAGNPTQSKLKINPLNHNLFKSANNFSNETTVKQAVNTITANNVVASYSNITYQSGNSIILNPGFEVQPNSTFKAQIVGCN